MSNIANKIYNCDHKIRVQVRNRKTGIESSEWRSTCVHIGAINICKLCGEINYCSSATINKDSKYD
jgi:hypothetical protein